MLRVVPDWPGGLHTIISRFCVMQGQDLCPASNLHLLPLNSPPYCHAQVFKFRDGQSEIMALFLHLLASTVSKAASLEIVKISSVRMLLPISYLCIK